jgi:hypothetical protein
MPGTQELLSVLMDDPQNEAYLARTLSRCLRYAHRHQPDFRLGLSRRGDVDVWGLRPVACIEVEAVGPLAQQCRRHGQQS